MKKLVTICNENKVCMTKILLIFVTLAILVTGAPAIALTISFATSTPISPASDWSENPDTTSLAFQKYNPAWGVLTKVTLELSGDMDTEISVTNEGNSPTTGIATTHLQMYFKYPGLSLDEPQINTYSDPLEFTNLAVGDTVTGAFNDFGIYTLKNYSSSAILAAFTGTDNIVLDADIFPVISVRWTGGNISCHQTTDASITGTVTYDYIAVPEPATILLFSLGLVVLRRKL